jgi:hypothetical protein
MAKGAKAKTRHSGKQLVIIHLGPKLEVTVKPIWQQKPGAVVGRQCTDEHRSNHGGNVPHCSDVCPAVLETCGQIYSEVDGKNYPQGKLDIVWVVERRS